MSDFDVSKQPNPAGLNTPSSGTYGEGAALERLKRSLPAGEPGAPAVQGPSPAPLPAPPQPYAGGPPKGLFGPTQQPNVPGSTPLAQPPQNPMAGAVTSRQRNLVLLDALIQSPTVSAETREWAESVRAHLINGSKR